MKRAVVSLLLLAAFAAARAELVPIEPARDDVSAAERSRIWDDIRASEAQLALPAAKAFSRPSFAWPLRAARGYDAPGFFQVSAFVDHNAAFPNAVSDYQCGARTYDRDTGYNHKGTDISLLPDGWGLMAAGQVEVIAAAPGTIVLKDDGNFDRNCATNESRWNAVYVRHDDGSVAWYGHLKSGSLTTRAVGTRVAAGEYLGTVGSSGSSTGPHLHFEVYDSLARLVDPFAGQCNSLNGDSWWANQPAYRETRVNRVVTATAPPVASSCGTDGKLGNPGSLNEKRAFAPGNSITMVAFLKDLLEDMPVTGRILRPDGTVWRTWAGAASHPTYSGAYYHQSYTLPSDAPQGTWIAEATAGQSTARTPFTVAPAAAPIAHYTDLWWNAAESGWGVNVNHQGDLLFSTWYTYDADGSGLWVSLPEARRQPDGSFTGTLYRTTGVAFSQIAGAPASYPPAAVGTATFRFTSAEAGTFSYTLNGVSQQKSITRLRFATPPQCMATVGSRASLTNYQDLWWNPAEPGWGVNLAHQGEILFATWFTYAAGGRGIWLSASEVRRQPTGEFRGRLYRTSGLSFDRIAGTTAMAGTVDVGEVTFTFADGENVRMDYTLEGVSQSKSLTRYVAASLVPHCR